MRIIFKAEEEADAKRLMDLTNAAADKSRLLGQCLTAMREAYAYMLSRPPHQPLALTDQPMTQAERMWRDTLSKLRVLIERNK